MISVDYTIVYEKNKMHKPFTSIYYTCRWNVVKSICVSIYLFHDQTKRNYTKTHTFVCSIKIKIYRHSLVDCGSSQLYLSVCVCLSVCPAFTAYISLTMGRILIKLGENVGTLIRLIVLKFEHSAAKGKTTHKGKIFWHFYAFQSISSRLRHTFFFKF